MAYPLDQPIVLTFQSYSDTAGTVLADATTVTLDLQKPDATVTTLTLAAADIVRVSLGTYSYTFTPATSGHYAFHWKATGPGSAQTAADGEFDVQFKFGAGDALDVLTLDEAKSAISNNAGAGNDALLSFYVTGISRFLDARCGPIVRRTVTGEEAITSGATMLLRRYPVTSITSITEYSGTTAQILAAESFPAGTTAYDFAISNADAGIIERRSGGLPVDFGTGGRILVTYVAGRYADTAAVDARFKMAAGIILANFWRGEHGLNRDDIQGVRFAMPYAAEALLADDLQTRVG